MNTIDLIFFTDLTTVNHKMCYLFHLCLTTDAGDKYSKIFSGYTQSKSLRTCKCSTEDAQKLSLGKFCMQLLNT